LRRLWGLGELPIKNIIHLLEAKGIRVFSLSIDSAQVDAFSMWHVNRPFVFLNTKKSCEHSRFDVAHKLGFGQDVYTLFTLKDIIFPEGTTRSAIQDIAPTVLAGLESANYDD